jgi:hypothetical protein
MLLGFAWALSPTAVAVAKTQPVVLDGSGMQGGLVQGPDGTVYGATQGGGRTPCGGQWGTRLGRYHGCGTIFRMRPNGQAETIYRFHGAREGVGPEGLMMTPEGNLMGMDWLAGAPDSWTARVFWLTQGGSITVKPAAQSPHDHGDLAWDGSQGFGTALDSKHPFYTLSLSGDVKLLMLPADLKAKCGPPVGLGDGDEDISFGPSIGPGGAAYATTEKCVLRLAARAEDVKIIAQTTKFGFVNAPQFGNDGNIYVAGWLQGPIDKQVEGVIRIEPSGQQTWLATLPPPDPNADANYITGFVMGRDHKIYGIAYLGGLSGEGMLFSMDRTGKISDLHDFCERSPRHTGCNENAPAPFGNILAAQDGTILGASEYGVFKYEPEDGTFRYIVVFNGR